MRRDALDDLLHEADALVWTALGAASLCERLDPLLSAATTETIPSALADDDPLLLAALGLVSLRRTTERWLHQAAPPTRPDEADEPGPERYEDLLR
jgi:hypothetical protein